MEKHLTYCPLSRLAVFVLHLCSFASSIHHSAFIISQSVFIVFNRTLFSANAIPCSSLFNDRRNLMAWKCNFIYLFICRETLKTKKHRHDEREIDEAECVWNDRHEKLG